MTNVNKASVTLPEQKREFSFKIDERMATSADKKESSLYIWVILNYEFGKDQKGEYGVIAEYCPIGEGITRLTVQDEWIL